MSQQQEYVVVERKTSATSYLVLMLMIMIFVSLMMQFYYYNSIRDLQQQITYLNNNIRILDRDLRDVSEGLSRYKEIDQMLNLYLKITLLKVYKEMFPELSEQQLMQLLYNMTKTTTPATNTTTTTPRR